MKEEAWKMIEIGLLASRYALLFAHSISAASFYTLKVLMGIITRRWRMGTTS